MHSECVAFFAFFFHFSLYSQIIAYLCTINIKIMCSINITLNDALVEKVRPSFADNEALERWLQQQMETVLLAYYELLEKRAKARKTIEAMRLQSEQNGNSELTLDEINEEIRLARQERKQYAN
jgi:lipid A disaccharide synthetase